MLFGLFFLTCFQIEKTHQERGICLAHWVLDNSVFVHRNLFAFAELLVLLREDCNLCCYQEQSTSDSGECIEEAADNTLGWLLIWSVLQTMVACVSFVVHHNIPQ